MWWVTNLADSPFIDVARAIGDPRLATVLRELARNVRTEINNAEFNPRPSDVRGALERLKARASAFQDALKRVNKYELEMPFEGHPGDTCREAAREVTPKVIAFCDRALSIINVKRGARKQSGRVTCALIVIEAWAFVHGEPPSQNNEGAKAACDAYWRACGCHPIGKGDDIGDWRRSLLAARNISGRRRNYIRDEIRRAGIQIKPDLS
jgi:hypothetical protein